MDRGKQPKRCDLGCKKVKRPNTGVGKGSMFLRQKYMFTLSSCEKNVFKKERNLM